MINESEIKGRMLMVILRLQSEKRVCKRVFQRINEMTQSLPDGESLEGYGALLEKVFPKWYRLTCIKSSGKFWSKSSRINYERQFNLFGNELRAIFGRSLVVRHTCMSKANVSFDPESNIDIPLTMVLLMKVTFCRCLREGMWAQTDGQQSLLTTFFPYVFSMICWGGCISSGSFSDLINSPLSIFKDLAVKPYYHRPESGEFQRLPVDPIDERKL